VADWRAYYEREAESKRFLPEHDPDEAHRTRFALSLFPERPGAVLEIGCGDGHLSKVLSGERIDVTGLDLARRRLVEARRVAPAGAYVQGSALALPFRDRSFDTVSAVEVIEHLEDPLSALREMRRVSRRHVLFTTPFDQKVEKVVCPHCLREFPMSGHVQSFDEARLRQVAGKAGLRPVRVAKYRMGAPRSKTPLRSAVRVTMELAKDVQNRFLEMAGEKGNYAYIGALCRTG
jgi:SAM-dependent methyltransferase